MTGVEVALIVRLAVIIGCCIAYSSSASARNRRVVLAALVEERGRTYAERNDRYAVRFSGTPFDTGDARHADPDPYAPVLGHPTVPGHPRPRARGLPDWLGGRQVGTVVDNDIKVGSEQFDRVLTAKCPEAAFATEDLDPKMTDYLLTLPELAWSLRGESLVVVRNGNYSLEGLDATLSETARILDRLPDAVWRQSLGQG
jgi:hypothetical protein